MKRLGWLVLGLPLFFFFLRGLADLAGSSPVPIERPSGNEPPLAEIFSSRRQQHGIVSFDVPSIFGPHICVAYGDPFSPTLDPMAAQFREEWRGDADDRTYHYKITIPADYPDNIVRIEIFDPDSVNQPNNNGSNFQATVVHTDIAVANGMPPTEILSCSSTRQNPCFINTGEDNLGLDLALVNPSWFARVDENRGVGSPPGSGACGEPSNYFVEYNTVTHFDLFYLTETAEGGSQETPLAWYYGQSGDFVVERNGFPRDLTFSSFDHQTDLLWVTPGGRDNLAQPVAVPTGCGSPNGGDFDPVTCPDGTPPGEGSGFEIDLSADVPGIVVDGDGNRVLFLDITSLSGSSENAFDIWAGPDDYLAATPGEVNGRNVAVLNDLDSHDAEGIVITAVENKLTSSNAFTRTNVPIGYVGPEYAGQPVYVSLYDGDSGAQPPITFFFDTIDPQDWSLTFSNPPEPDPDGQTGRCIIGACNAQFVDPPYRIDIPTLNEACSNPNDRAQQMVCTPFEGGRLMASYHPGLFDSYLWHMQLASPVISATIDGPASGQPGVGYAFSAAVLPLTAGQPITYRWETAGQPPITHTGGLTDTVVFSWPDLGTKTITLTVSNSQGQPLVVSHTIEIGLPVYLPVVRRE